MTATAFNQSQIEILRMFESHKSEDDLQRLKRFLIDYLYQRATEEADKVWDERCYTAETVEKWKNTQMIINL
ncbi:MAG: hypothetical protein U5L45_21210 [Saprospiraceae bacterium]|nr:hypothetical protein [Saprospiraceae bacterium]